MERTESSYCTGFGNYLSIFFRFLGQQIARKWCSGKLLGQSHFCETKQASNSSVERFLEDNLLGKYIIGNGFSFGFVMPTYRPIEWLELWRLSIFYVFFFQLDRGAFTNVCLKLFLIWKNLHMLFFYIWCQVLSRLEHMSWLPLCISEIATNATKVFKLKPSSWRHDYMGSLHDDTKVVLLLFITNSMPKLTRDCGESNDCD